MKQHGTIWISLLLALLCVGLTSSPLTAGADQDALTVTQESGISINVDNQSLSTVLRMMSEKRLFDMTGAAGNESVTLHFSNATLSDVLAKMMRGYNYVLVEGQSGGVPTLTVLGKIDRPAAGPDDRQAVARPAAVKGHSEPRSYVPPEPRTPPPAVTMASQPRQPLAQPQSLINGRPQAAGTAPPLPQPPGTPAQPVPFGGPTAREPVTGQQAAGAQTPNAQPPAGTQPPAAANAESAESQGVHF